MKYMRIIAGYTWTDYKTNAQIVKELKMTPILDKLLEYKRSWIQHVNRIPRNRLPRVMKHYCPTGRRNRGRPLKRLLDTWDRNGSTSGPTPWTIYDDDDDDGDNDDEILNRSFPMSYVCSVFTVYPINTTPQMILWCCVGRINSKQTLTEQLQSDDVTLIYVGYFVIASVSVLPSASKRSHYWAQSLFTAGGEISYKIQIRTAVSPASYFSQPVECHVDLHSLVCLSVNEMGWACGAYGWGEGVV